MLTGIVRTIARHMFTQDWQNLRVAIDIERKKILAEPAYSPPLVCQQLLVSGEDHRHARHSGYDVIAICRAVWRRATSGRREGASTIDQQIVRVLTGRYECTVGRKLKEICLAVLVRDEFASSVLPSIYLSIGYFGGHMNGFRAACAQLGLNPARLTLREAAEMVARLKYPQPMEASTDRLAQITRRAVHLERLRSKHLMNRTYVHLGEPPVEFSISPLASTSRTACAVS
jgi:monofunctional glycosyltransferase